MYRYISELGFRTPAIVNSLKIFVREFKDVPTVSVNKLNTEQINSALEIHSLSWQPSTDSTKLTKEFKFNSFKETFAFMGSISQVADQMNHYPKWTQKNNVVKVEITTPDCGGVSVKDILLAFTMESIAIEVSNISVLTVCDGPKVMDTQIITNWNSNFSKTEEMLQSFQRATAQL